MLWSGLLTQSKIPVRMVCSTLKRRGMRFPPHHAPRGGKTVLREQRNYALAGAVSGRAASGAGLGTSAVISTVKMEPFFKTLST